MLRIQYFIFQVQKGCRRQLFDRLRAARELHDSLLQGMHSLVLQFHFVLTDLSVDNSTREFLTAELERVERLTLEARTQLQCLTGDISPDDSLSQELGQMVSDLGLRTPAIRIIQYGRERPLRPLVKTTLYRSLREGLTNTLDHARASRVDLDLTFGRSEFSARFRDNGAGIPKHSELRGNKPASGLTQMRENILALGGDLQIWTSPGSGTEIEIHIPASSAY
jgi:signal transduction histidine kinase